MTAQPQSAAAAHPRAVAQEEVSAELVRFLRLLERVSVSLLVLALVGFGTWTLVYEVSLALDTPSTPALALALIVTAALGAVVLPGYLRAGTTRRVVTSRTAVVWALLVGVVVLGLGATGHRGLMVAVITVAAAGWVVRGLRRPRAALPDVLERRSPHGALWLTAWFWALCCAVLAAVTARPDGDDAYFVNLAQWVSDRGDFPVRDTMLGDEEFAALSSHSPPVHSIEGLVGAVGHVAGVSGGLLTYVVVPPVLTALAVLALGWLVSLTRVRFAPIALSAAVVFLLASGGSGATYGNFFALRMWQGKAALATLVIPLVTAAAIAYVERGGWRRQLVFVLGVVAAIGASNTAVFLIPVLVVGVVLAAFVVAGPRRAAGAALALVFPLGCGLAVMALAPERTGGGGDGATLDPLTAVPGNGGLFVVVALAVCIGWTGLATRVGRAVAVCLTLAAGAALLPPVTQLLTSAVGVGSVVWRMWWVVPVPLLVAGLVGTAADLWSAHAPAGLRRGWATVGVAALAGVVVALVPLAGGRWIWSSDNGARFVSPLAWKVPAGAEEEARTALRLSKDGDLVLAPWDVSRALSGMSVDVHPVFARATYLPAYEAEPSAHVPERMVLQKFVDSRTPPVSELRPAVDTLGVDTACVSRKRGRAVSALRELGFKKKDETGDLVCLRR